MFWGFHQWMLDGEGANKKKNVVIFCIELMMSPFWLSSWLCPRVHIGCAFLFFSLPRWDINDQEPGIKSNVQLDFISRIGFSLPSLF